MFDSKAMLEMSLTGFSSAPQAPAWVMATSERLVASVISPGGGSSPCKSSSRLTPGRCFL